MLESLHLKNVGPAPEMTLDLAPRLNLVTGDNGPYIRRGEVGNWLVSDAFDLKEPRSLEGEQAVAAAEALMREKAPSETAIKEADEALRKAGLPDIDTLWVRWRYFRDRNLEPTPPAPSKSPKRRSK